MLVSRFWPGDVRQDGTGKWHNEPMGSGLPIAEFWEYK
jgi:hypothetical protein